MKPCTGASRGLTRQRSRPYSNHLIASHLEYLFGHYQSLSILVFVWQLMLVKYHGIYRIGGEVTNLPAAMSAIHP